MRKLQWLLLLAVPIFLAGCTRAESVVPTPPDYTLTVREEYLEQGGNRIRLLYPVVDGLSDAAREKTINTSAREAALAAYTAEGLIATDNAGYEYTAADMQITLHAAAFYSVRISGSLFSESSGNTDPFVYILNCDIATGVFLDTEDIVSDYPRLKKLFLRGKFTQDFGDSDLASLYPIEEMLAQYKDAYGIYPQLYLAPGRLGILIETVPALGNAAGFSIDIRDAEKCLNPANASLTALLG